MADDNSQPEGVTIDRSGDRPRRTDNRSVLHMFHDELGKALGIGKGDGVGKHMIDGKPKSVMDAVNDAVDSAPPPGSESN